MSSRVTVIDIARATGVSKSTVSLVLQGSSLVSETTRTKVNEAIRDLGYVYNRSAANLRQSRSKIIGIVVNDLTNSFFAELAVGMDNVVQASGYVQFLAHSAENPDRQGEVIASMREYGIAGLIVSPARGTQAGDLKSATDSGIPVVVVVRGLPGAKVSSVMSENAAGTREAVRHLVSLGHRNIAFLGGFTNITNFSERVEGYRSGLLQAGLSVLPERIISSLPSRAGGVAAVSNALALMDKPTAAVCFNDAVAFGVCDGLRASGIEPGRDFGVVGFDNVIEAASAMPGLTTISVDPQGMGQRAAQLLFRHINARSFEPEHIISSVRLVIRESCGAAHNPLHLYQRNIQK